MVPFWGGRVFLVYVLPSETISINRLTPKHTRNLLKRQGLEPQKKQYSPRQSPSNANYGLGIPNHSLLVKVARGGLKKDIL